MEDSPAAPAAPAAFSQPIPGELSLSGRWTVLGIGAVGLQLGALAAPRGAAIVIDGTGLVGFDTVGAWTLQSLLKRLGGESGAVQMRGWDPRFAKMLELAGQQPASAPVDAPREGNFALTGRGSVAAAAQAFEFLTFLGETAVAFARSVAHPSHLRWRPVLHNIRSAGFDALPIIGLLSFLLGIVIAYQGADQLRRYGANIFVVDLVGLSMLREFAPLMTAIIVAGRSGSAYAAQIGTMAVTEEIDAMRTLGIAPLELLVLPKLVALVVVLPLLTFFADAMGVFGGMVMARAQLDVGFQDFLDRFTQAVDVSAYLIGLGKAPVFAAIIAMVGCFQGLRTKGGADSVGRQTTRSVVHSIFLVIVADALFSILFSLLDL